MTKKIAFVFPGQGSQFVGMGKDFFESFETAKKIYDTANSTLNRNISDICFNSDETTLKQTINSQPCIVATQIAMLNTFVEKTNILPQAVAGHSLGEYSALYCANVLNIIDTFKAIQKRAEAMDKIATGKMAAIMATDENIIKDCIEQAKDKGIISIANYNSLKQIVITGEDEAIDKATELLTQNGVKRIIPLAVSGAFHSPLMKEAGNDFSKVLDEIKINNAQIPVYTNVDAKAETKAQNFKEKMPMQIYSSVHWTQTIQNMVNDGVEIFIEIGSGSILKGLIKKTIPEATVYNIFDIQSLEDTINTIQNNL